jgi:hypothetical protein
MDGLPADLGKLVLAGYINANPPKQPQFALTTGGSGLATSIGQAGGTVSVDNFGGINLTVPGGAFLGLDSFNNISLNTSTTTGTITLRTDGAGHDVNIYQAGTIAFDTVGAGAITNVQTINGIVYPPPGGGGGTSITQAGALVSCLGNGAVLISSIGAGASVNVVNAGTIAFDSAGAKAISGLSTINAAPYVAFPGSLSSISSVGGSVGVAANNIALQTSDAAYIALYGTGAVNPNKIDITSGSGNAALVLGPSNTILLDNPGATIASYISMTDDGTIAMDGAAVNITNLSTVNGVQFVNGSAPYVLPADITVSTLTAAVSVDAPSFINVSSITNATNINISANGGDLSLYSDNGSVKLVTGTGLVSAGNILPESDITGNVGIPTQAWGGVYADAGYFSTMSNISSISAGTDYLSIYSGNTLTVETTDELHLKGGNIQVGTSGASTDIYLNGPTYIPTQELQVSSIVGVSSINGTVALSDASLTVGTLHATTDLTLDGAGTFTINGSTGAEGNVIAISSGYPAWVAPPVGIIGSGVIDNAAIQAATWSVAGASPYYVATFALPSITLNSAANASVNMFGGDPADAGTYWVVNVAVNAGDLDITLAADPTASSIALSWVVYTNEGTPP